MLTLIDKSVPGVRPVLLLLAITFAVYFSALFHDFCGDDSVVIVRNEFYSSLVNLPRLFLPSYFSNGNDLILKDMPDKGSGSVAYRPVLSLTYFIDCAFWGKNPFGFHLTNLLIHLANVVFYYLIFLYYLKQRDWAFWSALLFAIHPIQSEAVAAIGYRADLLSAFWCALAVLSWSVFRRSQKQLFLIFSLGAYILALFSKESAFFLCLWIIFSDSWLGLGWRRILKGVWPFFLVAAAYLLVYFKVFPNTALNDSVMAGFSWPQKLSSLSQIWFHYAGFFLCPSLAMPLPGLFYPFPGPLVSTLEFWVVLLLLCVLFWFAFAYTTRDKPYLLFLLWFVLFFAPASGLINNPNPAALRYLYLPGVGIYCLCAAGIVFLINLPAGKYVTLHWQKLCAVFIIFFCAIFSVINTRYWKDTISIAQFWAQQFPEFYKGHLTYGMELYTRRAYLEAIEQFEAALKDPRANDPRIAYYLARSYLFVGKEAKAKDLLEQLLSAFPAYSRAHEGLAQVYLRENNYARSLDCLREALRRDSQADYFYLFLKIAALKKDPVLVREVLERVRHAFDSGLPARENIEARGNRLLRMLQ